MTPPVPYRKAASAALTGVMLFSMGASALAADGPTGGRGGSVLIQLPQNHTQRTQWLEEGTNKTLKDATNTLAPDEDGTSDIEGYDLVRVDKANDGNDITNWYTKTVTAPAEGEPSVPEEGNPPADTPTEGTPTEGTPEANPDGGDPTTQPPAEPEADPEPEDVYPELTPEQKEQQNDPSYIPKVGDPYQLLGEYRIRKTEFWEAIRKEHDKVFGGEGCQSRIASSSVNLMETAGVSNSLKPGRPAPEGYVPPKPVKLTYTYGNITKFNVEFSEDGRVARVSASYERTNNITGEKREISYFGEASHTYYPPENCEFSATLPEEAKVSTRWVEDGTNKVLKDPTETLEPDEDGTSDIADYVLLRVDKTDPNHIINVYVKPFTVWVDEGDKVLKPQEEGKHPDEDGTSDVEGYTLVRVEKDDPKFVKNIYKKVPVSTRWIEDGANEDLKPVADTLQPDEDGTSDIEGFELVRVDKTDPNHIINIYSRIVTTVWVDEEGTELKPSEKGYHPDEDGTSDIPDYDIVGVDKDTPGVVKNIYAPKVSTIWVEEGTEKELQPGKDGAFPDNDGTSDIEGYDLVRVDTTNPKVTKNIYSMRTVTVWQDEEGTELKPQENGSHPDNDGTPDVEKYELVKVDTTTPGKVINVYRPVAEKVSTRWIEEGTDAVLKAPTETLEPDEDGTSDIDGYELVTVDKTDANHIVNVYKKATPPNTEEPPVIEVPEEPETTMRTMWIEEGSGTELQPGKDGAFPDDDGVSDIKGYKFIRTERSTERLVINVYSKLDVETPKETPQEPKGEDKEQTPDVTVVPPKADKGQSDAPQSATPEKVNPKAPAVLAKTGATAGLMGTLSAMLGGLGLLAARKRRQD